MAIKANEIMRILKFALVILISSSLVAYNSDTFAASKGAKSSKSSSHRGKSHSRSKGRAKAGSGDVWARIRAGIRIPRPSLATDAFGALPVPTIQKSSGSASRDVKTTDALRIADDQSARLSTILSPRKILKAESQLPEKLRAGPALNSEKGGNENKLDLTVDEKYTPLGRLKFAKKESSDSATESLSNKLHIIPRQKAASAKEKDDNAFKSASIQRIRTRLGLHPELFKNGEVPVDINNKSFNGYKKGKKSGSITTSKTQGAAITNCADLKKDAVISLAQQGFLAESYSQMAEECRIKQNEKVARVSRHLAGYSRGYLYQVSERARPYLYHIVDSLSKYGMPLDLALLPIVESAYQPTALSPMSAAGIWQFIPSTGREYGMEQTEEYDGRLDVTASTHAAIRFLSGLNGHFKGDWLLALAAYNCGQGTVDAAIARNQAEGLDTDFWSLDLPAETKDYVPRLLALATIFENPGGYGLKLRPLKNEPHFIKVNIDREADINQLVNKDLKAIAKLANFDPDQFSLLNSAYLKSTITQSRPFTILMPINNANLLHQSLAFMAQSYKDEKNDASAVLSKLPSFLPEATVSKVQAPLLSISLNEDQQWFSSMKRALTFGVKPTPTNDKTEIAKASPDTWSVHYLDKGETLKAVAEYHGVSEGVLREVNKFKRRQSIPLGQRLLVPLKQIAMGVTEKKVNPSVLYKDITGNLNPLHLRL